MWIPVPAICDLCRKLVRADDDIAVAVDLGRVTRGHAGCITDVRCRVPAACLDPEHCRLNETCWRTNPVETFPVMPSAVDMVWDDWTIVEAARALPPSTP